MQAPGPSVRERHGPQFGADCSDCCCRLRRDGALARFAPPSIGDICDGRSPTKGCRPRPLQRRRIRHFDCSLTIDETARPAELRHHNEAPLARVVGVAMSSHATGSRAGPPLAYYLLSDDAEWLYATPLRLQRRTGSVSKQIVRAGKSMKARLVVAIVGCH